MQNYEYKIFTDEGGDFVNEMCDPKKFIRLPMQIEIDGDILTVDENISQKDIDSFYDSIRSGVLPKTSQINQYTFEQYFEKELNSGKDVLYLALSSGVSNQFETANKTAMQLNNNYDNKVYCVDTMSATMGSSLITKRAIENRDSGMSIEDNFKDLNIFKGKINHWFTVNDLFHLKSGGRISTTKAIIGSALSVKPILIINDLGKLELFQSVRGKKQALRVLAEKFNNNVENEVDDVVITYVEDLDSANYVKDLINQTGKAKNIHTLPMSPIIATHTGIGAITLGFIGKNRKEMK
ncbi:MAG: DegV family protein [Tissierellia bacterium]|nr:DegV family protein [Tissierellia bacterium]